MSKNVPILRLWRIQAGRRERLYPLRARNQPRRERWSDDRFTAVEADQEEVPRRRMG